MGCSRRPHGRAAAVHGATSSRVVDRGGRLGSRRLAFGRSALDPRPHCRSQRARGRVRRAVGPAGGQGDQSSPPVSDERIVDRRPAPGGPGHPCDRPRVRPGPRRSRGSGPATAQGRPLPAVRRLLPAMSRRPLPCTAAPGRAPVAAADVRTSTSTGDGHGWSSRCSPITRAPDDRSEGDRWEGCLIVGRGARFGDGRSARSAPAKVTSSSAPRRQGGPRPRKLAQSADRRLLALSAFPG